MSTLKTINDMDLSKSLSLLGCSVSKDYFEYKMNIQTKTNNNYEKMNQETIDFLCDLIDKQYIYIQELETKYKALLKEFSFRKMIIDNHQNVLKTINQNVINRFIQKNYEQEQKIIQLEKENSLLSKENKNINNSLYVFPPPQTLNTISVEEKPASDRKVSKNLINALNNTKKTKGKAINVYQHKENFKKFETIYSSNSYMTLNTTSTSNKPSIIVKDKK